MIQIVEVVGLQGVLILGATEPTANAEVLHRLQKERSAGNFRGLAADARDHLIGGDFTFVQRLQLREHPRGASAISAADKGSHRVDAGILQNDVGKFAHFGAMAAKERSWSP